MSICLEKSRTKQIGIALASWILSAVVFILLAAFLIDRMKLNSVWIIRLAAAATFFSSFSASLALFHGKKSGNRWISALLLWMITASTLLMLGFMVDSVAMSLRGLVRILGCTLLGTMTGMVLRNSGMRKKETGKFKMGKMS